MKITDQAEANKYFEFLVADCMKVRPQLTREEAESIQRTNLGYYAGYYDEETRARVEALYSCQHPYFGKVAEKGSPTAAEALQVGIDLAAKQQQGGA